MPDDFSMPQLGNAAGPGGIPLGYGSPQQIQQYYMQMMRDKQKQTTQQPIRSWTQVAGNVLDTLADQINLNKMMAGAKANVGAETEAMFPGDGGHATPDGYAAPVGNMAQPGGNINQGATPFPMPGPQEGSSRPGGIPSSLTYPMGGQAPGAQPSAGGANDNTLMPAMSMSSMAETSKKGAAALSNISPDSAGSKSYGPWGLNSKTGSAAQFVATNPSLGITAQPGTKEFDDQWKAAAQRNPDAMLQAHQSWYQQKYLAPVAQTLSKAGVSPQIAGDPRVQAYMADRTLQMGTVGQDRILAAAKSATTPEGFIHAVSASDHANIQNDFRTYLRDYPQNTKGLGNRIDWRQGGSMVIGGKPPQVEASAPATAAPGGGVPPTAPAMSAAGAPSMIGQSGYFVPETAISRPPVMSQQQAKQAYQAAAMRGDTAGAKQIHDDYIKQFMPIEIGVPGGTVRVNPSNHRDQHFIPTLEKTTEKLPGGIERPLYQTISPSGVVTRLPTGETPSAPATAPAPAGGEGADAGNKDEMTTFVKNTPDVYPKYPGEGAPAQQLIKFGSAQKEYEGSAEDFRKEYKNISKESLDARDNKTQLQLLERVLQNPAVQSGFANKTIANWNDAGRVAGLGKGETATWNAIAQKLGSRQQVSDIAERTLGQGTAVRATEASAIKESQFSLDKTPEANLAVARLQLRAMDRIVDNGKFANEYAKQHGRLDNGYYQARDEWFANHPFMSDEELNNYHDLTKGAPSPDRSTEVTGPAGSNPPFQEALKGKELGDVIPGPPLAGRGLPGGTLGQKAAALGTAGMAGVAAGGLPFTGAARIPQVSTGLRGAMQAGAGPTSPSGLAATPTTQQSIIDALKGLGGGKGGHGLGDWAKGGLMFEIIHKLFGG